MTTLIQESARIVDRKPPCMRLLATFDLADGETAEFNMSRQSLLAAFTTLDANLVARSVTWVIRREVTLPATEGLTVPEKFCGMYERQADDLVGFNFPEVTELWFSTDGKMNRAAQVQFAALNVVNPAIAQFARTNIPSIRGNWPHSVNGFAGLNDQNAQGDFALDAMDGFWGADTNPQLVAATAGGVSPRPGDAPGTEYVTLPLTWKSYNGRHEGMYLPALVQTDKVVTFSFTRHDRAIAPAAGALYPAGTTIAANAVVELWIDVAEARGMPDNKDDVFIGLPWYMFKVGAPSGGFQDVTTAPKFILRCFWPRFDMSTTPALLATDTTETAGAGYTVALRYYPPRFPTWWADTTQLWTQEDRGGVLTTTFPEDPKDQRAYQFSMLWNRQNQCESGRSRIQQASRLAVPPVGEDAPVYTSAASGTILTGVATYPTGPVVPAVQFVTHNRGNLDIANMVGAFSAHPIYPMQFVTQLATFVGITTNGGAIACASRFNYNELTMPDAQIMVFRARPDLRQEITALAACGNGCKQPETVINVGDAVEIPGRPNSAAASSYVGAKVNTALVQSVQSGQAKSAGK